MTTTAIAMPERLYPSNYSYIVCLYSGHMDNIFFTNRNIKKCNNVSEELRNYYAQPTTHLFKVSANILMRQ